VAGRPPPVTGPTHLPPGSALPHRGAALPGQLLLPAFRELFTHYEFRFNNANPGLPTDRWLVQCHPSSTSRASDPACWGSEARLTDSSFNMEAVSSIAFNGRPFLGDYFGLAGVGDGFVTTFTQVDNQNITSIFARRIGP
jgi:hypothetical protein